MTEARTVAERIDDECVLELEANAFVVGAEKVPLADAIEAALASAHASGRREGLEEGAKWQPIDSVPIGRPILVGLEGYNSTAVEAAKGSAGLIYVVLGTNRFLQVTPTHWQELPQVAASIRSKVEG